MDPPYPLLKQHKSGNAERVRQHQQLAWQGGSSRRKDSRGGNVFIQSFGHVASDFEKIDQRIIGTLLLAFYINKRNAEQHNDDVSSSSWVGAALMMGIADMTNPSSGSFSWFIPSVMSLPTSKKSTTG
mmetsp:Transcript_16333/g.40949  ORF Transcript_16333/g.40949 Transcript_16333/m.40949 type:complete len:128 (+) Transcript_16333:466-849(+)